MSDNQDFHSDPILDSMLDEILGAQEPPDLTERILSAHQSEGEVQPTVASRSDRAHRSSSRRKSSVPSRRYTGWGVAAVVLLGAVGFSLWAWQQQRLFEEQFRVTDKAAVNPADESATSTINVKPTPDAIAQDRYEGQEENTVPTPWDLRNQLVEDMGGLRKAKVAQKGPIEPGPPIERPAFERTEVPGAPSSVAQIVNFVNQQLAEGWRRAGVAPTKGISERAWTERVAQALVGRAPTNQELQKFSEDLDREAFVDRMLAHTDFASHWAKVYSNLLLGNADKKSVDEQRFEDYLRESIASGKPMDQLTFELITAQGRATDATAPEVNFLLAHHQDGAKQQRAVEKICQVFLGAQLQCARCHDDPSNPSLTQQSYYELAAFLTQMQVEQASNGDVLLVDRDYLGTDGKSPDDADLFYEEGASGNGTVGSVAYPRFPGKDQSVSTSGRLENFHRRVELANTIVASDRFSATLVNRLWSQVFSRGFREPVEATMNPRHRSSHPQLLTRLADEFQKSDYDLRTALRWMVRSAAFDRQVRTKDDPMIGQFDGFSSFSNDEIPSELPVPKLMSIAAAKEAQATNLVHANLSTRTPNVPTGGRERAMQTTNRLHREPVLSSQPGSLIHRLSGNASLSDEQAVEHLFFALLGRAPTTKEKEDGMKLFSNGRKSGLVEIGRIVIGSREYADQN